MFCRIACLFAVPLTPVLASSTRLVTLVTEKVTGVTSVANDFVKQDKCYLSLVEIKSRLKS